MGILVPLSDGSTGHLSFSRMEGMGPFRRKERQCLQHYSPILVELLGQYLEHRLSHRALRGAPPLQGPLEDLIRAHVKTTTQTAITRRDINHRLVKELHPDPPSRSCTCREPVAN